MPQGSKPGERRGGRQRGTPNKTTVLKDAVLCTAAAHPNSSPLDFMLGLMRDPKVPIDLRIVIAAAAAPFVHHKPSHPGQEPLSATRPGSRVGISHANPASKSSAQKMDGKLTDTVPQVAGDTDLNPLDFLLSVMN